MKTFLIVWLGQFISGIGTGLGSFALGIWVFQRNQSATQFAMVPLVAGLTMILINPFGGALADRLDRRRLMLLSDIGSGLMTLLLATLLFLDLLRPWHVYPIVALMVALGAIQGPALSASVSLLVPREHLARASGMAQTSRAIAQIIGPFAAGLLVGRIGYHGVIYIDCVSFFAAAAMLLFVRLPNPRGESSLPQLAPPPEGAPASGPPAPDGAPPLLVAQPQRRPFLQDLAYGWRYLRQRQGLFALLSMYAVTNFSMGIVQVLLTPLILSIATPVEMGSVNSAAAAGGLLGGIALAIWGGPRSKIWGIFGVMLFQGCVLFLGGIEPSVPLIALASFAFMLSIPIGAGCNQAILQSKVSSAVQGRVFGMAGFIAAATVPLASLAAGPLADRVFGPALMPGGALADTAIARLIGVGPGRGVGLLFILLGFFVLLAVGIAFLNPRLRRLEHEIPDAPRPGLPSLGSQPAAVSAPFPAP